MSQLTLFPRFDQSDLTEELFEAYFECRKNKRNSPSALRFERRLESRLFALSDTLYNGQWKPSPSTAFIVRKPVQREVFAATFADRVVHHWLMAKLNPHFEQLFIEDSYACRVGKGTLFGIRRLEHHVRDVYGAHPRGGFVLKLDIRGFFMSIPRAQLWARLRQFIGEQYREADADLVLQVTRAIALTDATDACQIAGQRTDWRGLPPDKSLFTTAPGCGLPIGNLTSQVFANFYLHPLDAFITQTLGFHRYGRYVDDFYLVHPDPAALRHALRSIRRFLADELTLQLHPRKVVLQHAAKGTAFLGAVVWPTHTTVGKRLKGNFYAAIREINASQRLDPRAVARINSYLGLTRQFRSHRLRRRVLRSALRPGLAAELISPRALQWVRWRDKRDSKRLGSLPSGPEVRE